MGFLTEGNTLLWNDAKPFLDYVREHGILQFLHILNTTQSRSGDCLKWGDEIEYLLLHFDDEKHTVRCGLRAPEILEELMIEEIELARRKALGEGSEGEATLMTLWRPEYARFMIEGTPGQPYGDCVTEFRKVEINMRLRRERVQGLLHPDERIATVSNFPLLGALLKGDRDGDGAPIASWAHPAVKVGGTVSESLFTSDELIFPHKRFATLTQNIRERRGAKVEIKVPVFKDRATQAVDNAGYENASSDEIYMDSMAFGMGMHCLQCTFQCVDINESRMLYDQLAVMAPIMLALTAATPVFRGYLSDTDVRWFVLSDSVDDRTQEERGLAELAHNRFVINKSRYSSIDAYIAPPSPDYGFKDAYNDIPLIFDENIYKQLAAAGIDERLARHIAHLFIRDPLVIYDNKIELDDSKAADHFENVQSTNWRTVRFKPPPPNSDIGWRTEFRPMEIQLTDFENAALAVFMILLTRAIRSFGLNFYLPLSLVDLNMHRAARRDAVNTQQFYFRTHLSTRSPQDPAVGLPPHLTYTATNNTTTPTTSSTFPEGLDPQADAYSEMSLNEIMNGSDRFKGLIPVVEEYIQSINIDAETGIVVRRYMQLLSRRASGELLTAASWTRQFIMRHPDYKHDSIVTQEIAYDLMKAAVDIGEGRQAAPTLLGDLYPPEQGTLDLHAPPKCTSTQ